MRGAREHYDYLPLREAILRKGEEVNFYGAVSEYDHPKPTRGSDVLCTMSVVDMSYDSPGLRVLVFASTAASCPLVKNIGDIIRFHRVQMGDFNGEAQAVANIRRKASFILFHGKDGSGSQPYQKAHTSYSFDRHDEQRLDVMRNWVEAHPLCARTSAYLVPISGMKENSYFDLCCKILFVDGKSPERYSVIYVWDGTDALLRPLPNPGPGTDAQMASPSTYPILPWDLICDIPSLGTVLPIIQENQLDDLPGQVPQRGDWVKFRNLACRNVHGVLEAVFTRESKTSLLSTESELVKSCETRYEMRILSPQGRLPESCTQHLRSMTVTDHEHVCFSTLREVLASPEVTYKFRCLVRVISVWPSAVVDFCSPTNNMGTDHSKLEFVYGVLLALEDPTARLNAYLYGEDAIGVWDLLSFSQRPLEGHRFHVKFFNGHVPADLHQDSSTVGAIERKVQKLLGIKVSDTGDISSTRDPPWIKCCIKSYYTDKSNPRESRCFRIFGTIFPG